MQKICINSVVEKIANHYGYNYISSDAIVLGAGLISALNNHYKFVNSMPFIDAQTLSTERCEVIDALAELQISIWLLNELLNCGDELTDSILIKLSDDSDAVDESDYYVL